jgi:FixJ family two-component response regulator
MKICDFTKPELDKFRKECNFTDIERQCFDLKARDKTNTQLAMELNVSESTISVVMRRVRTKITRVLNWEV